MAKQSEEQIQAFGMLAIGHEWEIVKQFLESRLLEYDEQNRAGEGPAGHRIQGRAIELSEILALFNEAKKKHRAIQEAKKNPVNPTKVF